MPPVLRIEQLGIDPKTFFRRSLIEAHKAGMKAMGVSWHEEILPKHFTKSAPFVYGYVPRSEGYVSRKIKKTGTNLPGVFTGRLRAQMLRDAAIKVTNKQVTVKMSSLPDYIDMSGRARKVNRITDKAPILERLTRAKAKAVKENKGTLAQVLQKRIDSINKSKTAGRYPPLKKELTATAKADVALMLARYDDAAKYDLKMNPEARKKSRTKLTKE